VNVVTGLDPFNTEVLSGAYGAVRPNLIPGVPLWIANPDVAGGREINPAAFTIPGTVSGAAVQGDLGRNALRGFGAAQVDFALRRQFKLHERLALQARADLFNIFNHPNFGPPINYLSSPQFGQSTQMLGASLGKRRPVWRPQSSLSNRRANVGATVAEARLLSIKRLKMAGGSHTVTARRTRCNTAKHWHVGRRLCIASRRCSADGSRARKRVAGMAASIRRIKSADRASAQLARKLLF
jgi:hypothetical protein